MQTLTSTQLNLDADLYRGKVRDVYSLKDGRLLMVASDRISAFDVILPRAIPYKGQILNTIAKRFLEQTQDIVPNWLESSPHPNVSIGKKCEPIPLEFVIRGYLTGHAWRTYKSGKRKLSGVTLPEGMKEHDRFPAPIITPATKAEEGHDEDISKAEILEQGILKEAAWEKLEEITHKLFARGTELAAQRGLILVDTKYEFGYYEGELMLMDEIHTPDSSRYFYAEGYAERQAAGEAQKQLSKEFVREWLMENGFQGKDGQEIPEMTDEVVQMISGRYQELYEKLMGEAFVSQSIEGLEEVVKASLK
ncbi:MAG: phosphoribosylaminoimidazolesuccinocarboxamide synthase [Bacteroidota bacterium]